MTGAPDLRRPARRPASHLLALAVVLALAVTGMTAASALASGPTIAVGSRTLLGAGTPRYKPHSVRVTAGGRSYLITGIHWRGWNSSRATGVGRVRFGGRRVRGTLIASSRAYCSTLGAFLYERLQVRL